MTVQALVEAICDRETPRTEATLQANIRNLLLGAEMGLEAIDLQDIVLEAPLGDRRRIDIEVGSCVIEVKKDLRGVKVLADAADQLEGYLRKRTEQTSLRYVGLLTDGQDWRCYNLRMSGYEEVSRHEVSPKRPDAQALIAWLEGVLATAQDVPPTPTNIRMRLGAGSSSHALDRVSLASLYDDHNALPTIQAKRRLWSRLLTTALGTHFQDRDALFIEHTLLVVSAEIIAHAVLGIDPAGVEPQQLITGGVFKQAGVHGVVEADFFDWIGELPAGENWVRTLARRLRRFRWDAVEHDVLKLLYESVIGAETRRKLGEYYTPDWLAQRVVSEVVTDPLSQRVLDPACGSGTFLFHAVRRYLGAADQAGLSVREALDGLSDRVIGMDLHPVAVTLARVTYLLAIGRERLAGGERGEVQVPVYLGDSLQWQFSPPDLWTAGNLSIRTDAQPDLFESELLFPESLLEKPRSFDALVQSLAQKAADREPGSEPPSLEGLLDGLEVMAPLRMTIEETFAKLCYLSDEGRDHVWSYYIRNLARPVWLARPENRVDVLVGNPPWLAFRNMTPQMQEGFRAMSTARKLWEGAKVATHQDLSALFVVRAVELYLKPEGKFGMVMPNAVLDRGQFKGFRTGSPGDLPSGHLAMAFELPWDLRRLRPHFFPRGSAVVFGRRVDVAGVMPLTAEVWTGRVDDPHATWEDVSEGIERDLRELSPVAQEPDLSPYQARFSQGATLVPRCLAVVVQDETTPLGVPAGQVSVRSSRSATEKPPWKNVPDVRGVVERKFVRPLYTGATVLPFRARTPLNTVLPLDGANLMEIGDPRMEAYPGLKGWWGDVSQIWLDNRSSERLTLAQQFDYRGKLTKQFPVPPDRVVYSASGMHLSASRIPSSGAVCGHSLYWSRTDSEAEALYLCAILNSATLTEQVRPLMSYGKDERHFDKYVWQLPIPVFSSSESLHEELAAVGRELEQFVGALDLPEDGYFVTLRKQVRSEMRARPEGRELESLVGVLLTA